MCTDPARGAVAAAEKRQLCEMVGGEELQSGDETHGVESVPER